MFGCGQNWSLSLSDTLQTHLKIVTYYLCALPQPWFLLGPFDVISGFTWSILILIYFEFFFILSNLHLFWENFYFIKILIKWH